MVENVKILGTLIKDKIVAGTCILMGLDQDEFNNIVINDIANIILGDADLIQMSRVEHDHFEIGDCLDYIPVIGAINAVIVPFVWNPIARAANNRGAEFNIPDIENLAVRRGIRNSYTTMCFLVGLPPMHFPLMIAFDIRAIYKQKNQKAENKAKEKAEKRAIKAKEKAEKRAEKEMIHYY